MVTGPQRRIADEIFSGLADGVLDRARSDPSVDPVSEIWSLTRSVPLALLTEAAPARPHALNEEVAFLRARAVEILNASAWADARPESLADTLEVARRALHFRPRKDENEHPEPLWLAGVEHDGDEVGSVLLRAEPTGDDRTAEVGFRLDSEFQGGSLERRLIPLATLEAFERFDHLDRLVARVDGGSGSVVRAFEQARYRRESYRHRARRQGDRWIGEHVLCVARGDYEELAQRARRRADRRDPGDRRVDRPRRREADPWSSAERRAGADRRAVFRRRRDRRVHRALQPSRTGAVAP